MYGHSNLLKSFGMCLTLPGNSYSAKLVYMFQSYVCVKSMCEDYIFFLPVDIQYAWYGMPTCLDVQHATMCLDYKAT